MIAPDAHLKVYVATRPIDLSSVLQISLIVGFEISLIWHSCLAFSLGVKPADRLGRNHAISRSGRRRRWSNLES